MEDILRLGDEPRVVVARLPYLRFARVVERARREVLREPEYADARDCHVLAMSWEFSVADSETGLLRADPWGECYKPKGPVVIYQAPYELMPDQERYYAQIKDVLRHEFRHYLGRHDHGRADNVATAS